MIIKLFFTIKKSIFIIFLFKQKKDKMLKNLHQIFFNNNKYIMLYIKSIYVLNSYSTSFKLA